MEQCTPEKMAAQSRYRRYFPTLPEDVRADVYARMRELVREGAPTATRGSYDHMAQIHTSVALYEVLQAHDASKGGPTARCRRRCGPSSILRACRGSRSCPSSCP